MQLPYWIEIAGRLGPLAVATAVYLSTRAQNRWQNRVTARTAAIEDQKLRLALLDRRMTAIESVREIVGSFWTEGRATQAMVAKAVDALQVVELVYEADAEEAVSGLIKDLQDWQRWDRRTHRYIDEAKLNEAVDTLVAIEERLMESFPKIVQTLLQSARVNAVPGLPEPVSVFSFLPFAKRGE